MSIHITLNMNQHQNFSMFHMYYDKNYRNNQFLKNNLNYMLNISPTMDQYKKHNSNHDKYKYPISNLLIMLNHMLYYIQYRFLNLHLNIQHNLNRSMLLYLYNLWEQIHLMKNLKYMSNKKKSKVLIIFNLKKNF